MVVRHLYHVLVTSLIVIVVQIRNGSTFKMIVSTQ